MIQSIFGFTLLINRNSLLNFQYMSKGKTTFQTGKSESGLAWYTYAVQKRNLPAGEKLSLMKYDKKLRKHVKFTFKDTK